MHGGAARLVLSVHDELLFEVDPHEIAKLDSEVDAGRGVQGRQGGDRDAADLGGRPADRGDGAACWPGGKA